MNLKDLEYIIALAETGHFGKAAQSCFVSQPTLSHQLKKLEDELGVILFERAPKQVIPTAVGAHIIEKARQVVRITSDIIQLATSDPLSGEFTIGIIPTISGYLLPRVMPELVPQFPKLKLVLIEDKTDALIRQLEQGKLDCMIAALPVSNAGFDVMTLVTDPFYLAVPAHHSLAQKRSVTLADIQEEPLLLLEEGHCLRDQALSVCSLHQKRSPQNYQATSLETIRYMVASGLGCTLLPKISLRNDPLIATIPFMTPGPSRTIAGFWRNASSRQPLIHDILTHTKRVLSA
jgi:LysR family hydrogen peroxide-inducible transcriptional activator